MTAAYANPRDLLAGITRDLFTPRPRVTVDRWCDTHRRLPRSGAGAAVPGPWNTDEVPYLRGPMRAFTDPAVEEIALQKSTQVGASEFLVSCALYTIDTEPQTQMFVYPTATKGKKFNTDRLVPSIKSCPPIARLLRGPRDLTAEQLRLDGSLINFAYTGSSDALRSDPVPKIYLDETDAYDHSGEDPTENARSRQETFEHRKLLKTSTPMSDTAGITKEYDDADVRCQYQVPCPRCGQFFELFDFGLLGWIGGVHTEPKAAASNCWIQCPHADCTAKIREENKRWMVQHGLWITQGEWIESDGSITGTIDPLTRRLADGSPMASRLGAEFFRDELGEPDPADRNAGLSESDAADRRAMLGVAIRGIKSTGPRVGFRINRFASLISEKGWAGVVEDFVRANGRPDATWWRDRIGRSPSTKGERVESADLKQLMVGSDHGGHDYGQCPEWTAMLFGGVDVQKKCLKVLVKAYAIDGREAVVYTKAIPRDPDLKLADVLRVLGELGGFPVMGTTRRLDPFLLIDSGHWTLQVYDLVDELRARYGKRFLACKGNDGRLNDPAPYRRVVLTEHRDANGNKYALPKPVELVHVNTDHYKDRAAARMRPLSDEQTESLAAMAGQGLEGEAKIAEVRRTLAKIEPAQLPGEASWADCDAVIRELTNAEKVTIGAGSGRGGNDGRGRTRTVWRPKHKNQPDDYLDGWVYADAYADLVQIDQWTPEMLARQSDPTPKRSMGNATKPASEIAARNADRFGR